VLYFDTSFLTPLFLTEATSETIGGFFRDPPGGELAISQWTAVEFSSVIARRMRMGGLDREGAARADARFTELVERSFIVLLPSRDDFTLARQYLRRFETGLRAGDALHLAIASNSSATTIYSLDKAFVSAGKSLNLPTSPGIRGV
jgi:uncharacterized protein